MTALDWRTDPDGRGEALYLDGEFLGCTYDRRRSGRKSGTLFIEDVWRVLDADFRLVTDVGWGEATTPRQEARKALETHVGGRLPLPTAAELLAATSGT